LDQLTGAMVDEDTCYGRRRLAFGKLELCVLKIDQTLSERTALLHIFQRRLQGALDHGKPLDCDHQALLRQLLHELSEATSFFAPEQIVSGHLRIQEEQLRGVACLESELLELAAAPETT